ncbi:MAG: hypothetical protein JXB30_00630 [Anaerolineae bacterium]|nr:hypothetical protein [Anaerolineae bacterium]
MAKKESRLSSYHFALVVELVCSGMPLEVCGFPGGVGGTVTEVLPVPNVTSDPTITFLMEPQV